MRRDLGRDLALLFPLSWNTRRTFRLPERDIPRLGSYYVQWQSDNSPLGESWDSARQDPRGVILSTNDSYHPVRIAQYALHNYDLWITKQESLEYQRFISQATWLRDNQQSVLGIGGCYPYDFPLPEYGAEAGWISGMAQGEAISVLLRAHQELPTNGFVEAAIAAAQPFKYPVTQGGVTWRNSNDDLFFEEAAVVPASHVLNGHLFALWGLWELHRIAGESWLSTLINDAQRTLDRRLGLFDSGYWSYYNLLATRTGYRRVAILKYHDFHIAQLRVTAVMLNDPYLNDTADRWEDYVHKFDSRSRLIQNTICGLVLRYFTNTRGVQNGERSVLPDG